MLRRKKQDSHEKHDPFSDPSSIGNVLLKLGKITNDQLMKAVGQRAQFDEHLLGALLKQLGFVGDSDIAMALKIQAEMRSGREAHAELDVLDAKTAESRAGAERLRSVIADVKSKRRESGENSKVIFLPALMRGRG